MKQTILIIFLVFNFIGINAQVQTRTIINEIDIENISYITQYTNNPLLEQLGEIGAVVTVRRVIRDLDENIVFDQDIIFEYYQPKSEILGEE